MSLLYTMDAVTVEVENCFTGEVHELLRQFHTYLRLGPYEMTYTDRQATMARICEMNDHYRTHWWETVEKLDTMVDPISVVFLYEIYMATADWFRRQRDRSPTNHCSLCLFLMYTLVGQCINYKRKPFLTKTMDYEELTGRVLRVYDETDLTGLHFTFMKRYPEVLEELTNKWNKIDKQ